MAKSPAVIASTCPESDLLPRYTCQYTRYNPIHPNTPATYTHSVTNNTEIGCGKKTETRATDAAMPINGAPANWQIRRPIDYSRPGQLTHL